MMVPGESEQHREEEKLTNHVMIVACVQFALAVMVQLFLVVGTLGSPSGSLPANYSDFLHTFHESQSAFRSICDAWEHNCVQKGLTLDHCNDDGGYYKFQQAYASAVKAALLVATAVGVCCAAYVPACGFFGARNRDVCCLRFFIIFNILDLIFGVYQLTSHVVGILAMVMPVISTYLACRLKQTISSPPVTQRGPQAPLNQYTQSTTPQPPVAQAFVVTPNQQPNTQNQAFHGVPGR
eukprot:TRINITY_DN95252_c0_g1_i1.p1 TRINITY_DN95252_c0_g1~~TRINITY_DN95252_c0_g1_i1.p1  ORF type:complete len:238 (-),score=31.47 TRINITY_DN95252_c0_g1_i1:100-813(-)